MTNTPWKRGNSLETPNVWVLSSFHPNVSKHQPPPQCLGFVLFSPRRFYRAEVAATWMPRQQLTGRGSHVAAMSAKVSSRPKKKNSLLKKKCHHGQNLKASHLLLTTSMTEVVAKTRRCLALRSWPVLSWRHTHLIAVLKAYSPPPLHGDALFFISSSGSFRCPRELRNHPALFYSHVRTRPTLGWRAIVC